MGTPESDPRAGLRAFAANLLLVGDGLFFGALFFTYCFRRANADDWRTAWQHIDGTPVRLGVALALFAGAAVVYGGRWRTLVSALLGAGAAAILITFAAQADVLRLESGNRAAAIALLACVTLFAVHAVGVAVGGVIAKGEPVYRRFLLFQLFLALVILPVVFTW